MKDEFYEIKQGSLTKIIFKEIPHRRYRFRNSGNLPLKVSEPFINSFKCSGFGLSIFPCAQVTLQPGEETDYIFKFTPEFPFLKMQKEINFISKRRSFNFVVDIEMPIVPLETFEVRFHNLNSFFKYFFTLCAVLIGFTTLKIVSPKKPISNKSKKKPLLLDRASYFSDEESEEESEVSINKRSIKSEHSDLNFEETPTIKQNDFEKEISVKAKSKRSGDEDSVSSLVLSKKSSKSSPKNAKHQKDFETETQKVSKEELEKPEILVEKSKLVVENLCLEEVTKEPILRKESDDFEELAGCIRDELNVSNIPMKEEITPIPTSNKQNESGFNFHDEEEKSVPDFSIEYFQSEINKSKGSQYYSLFGEIPEYHNQFSKNSNAFQSRKKKISGDLADDEYSFASDNSLSQNSSIGSSLNSSMRGEPEPHVYRNNFSYLNGPRLPDFLRRRDFSEFYRTNYSNFYSSLQNPRGFGNSLSFTSNPINFGRTENDQMKNFYDKGKIKPPPGFASK